jgi:hypothetical protein
MEHIIDFNINDVKISVYKEENDLLIDFRSADGVFLAGRYLPIPNTENKTQNINDK